MIKSEPKSILQFMANHYDLLRDLFDIQVKNDIITGFDGDSISSFSDLKEKMQYYASGEKVTIDYYHMENGEYKLKSAEVTLGHNSN